MKIILRIINKSRWLFLLLNTIVIRRNIFVFLILCGWTIKRDKIHAKGFMAMKKLEWLS